MDRYEADIVMQAQKTESGLPGPQRWLINRLFALPMNTKLSRYQKHSLQLVKTKLNIKHVKL